MRWGRHIEDLLKSVTLPARMLAATVACNDAGTPKVVALCPMAFSNPINNLKNPSTGELKICRISAFAGSVEGEEEVIILIERVKKGDIHVRFFELDQDEERVWEDLAEFQEGDVHHQYAIVFKTPK